MTACRIISWAAHASCFLQLADLLHIGSVIQIIINYGGFCTCHKESETKISILPLPLFISAFQKSPVYFFLLIFHILFKETEVAGFCACVLTQLFLFKVTSLAHPMLTFYQIKSLCATVLWTAVQRALERRCSINYCCRGSREAQTGQFVSALC